ncbi:hypothetical protein JK161_00385 [Leuconostoc mesenteroides]|nr:hypothetical protein [Leuconostoc mesenteroides]MBS0941302.1 hypothetical protein [Leuconostoc mesenteroides]
MINITKDKQAQNRVGTVLFILLLLDIFHIVKVSWLILFVLYLIYG